MRKLILNTLLLAIGSVLFVSCEKNDTSLDGAGASLVKFIGGGPDAGVYALDYETDPQEVEVVDIRRDAANSGDLNKPVVITITNTQAFLDAYNDEHGTAFELLPDDAYSVLPNPYLAVSGDTWTVTLPAGVFATQIGLSVLATEFDLAKSYALGLQMTNTTVGNVSVDAGTYVANVLIKNEYDGKYTLNGKFYHPTQSPGYDPFTVDAELHTSGATSVKLYIPEFGGYYGPGLFAGVLNAFGSQEPEYTVNPATNKVVAQNGYSAAVTFYTMAPGYDSRYDPTTKTFYVKYGYNYSAGPVFNPATNREWEYELVYVGPR